MTAEEAPTTPPDPTAAAHPLLRCLQTHRPPRARITGLAVELPERRVSNEEIADRVIGPERIKRQLPTLILRTTRIAERRQAEPHELPSDYAARAGRRALAAAGLQTGQIDTLMFAATDADLLEPATGNIVQHKLGIEICNSFDVNGACNSFLQALSLATAMIHAGTARRVLVTSAELGSQWTNYNVESRDELRYKIGGLTLGDAGAAAVVEASDGQQGFLEFNLITLGRHWEVCHVPHDLLWRQEGHGERGWFFLDMAELARLVRHRATEYFEAYFAYRKEHYGEETPLHHVAKVVPHQISRTMIEEITDRVHDDRHVVAVTADHYGNTAATAIPLALHDLIQSGELALGSGQEVMLFGAASGFGMGHLRVRL